MSDFVFRNGGDTVPSVDEVATRLGPLFTTVVEQAIDDVNRTSCVHCLIAQSGLLQGLYLAAAALDRLDKRLLIGYQIALRDRVAKRIAEVTQGGVATAPTAHSDATVH